MPLMQKIRAWSHQLTGYFIFLLFAGTLGPFLFGYHLGELNAPQDVITCAKKSIRSASASLPQCIPMNTTQVGMVSSAFTVGGLIGSLAAGPLAARYGRLWSMRITTIFAIIGPVIEAVTPNIGLFIFGRIVSGLGAGAALVVVPLYVSEISPPSEKGFFGAFSQVMTNTGIFTAQLLGYFLSYDYMWRVIMAAGGAFGLLQIVCLIFAVDSPVWQASHGHPHAAKANLRKIRGHDADLTEETKYWSSESSEQGDDEQQLLLDNDAHLANANTGIQPSDAKRNLGTFEVFRDSRSRFATLAAMVVLVAQQFCGINAIIMYGVSLLSGLLQSNSALLNILVSLLNIIVTTACAPLLDVIGRKVCLLSSISGMFIASILLGVGIRSAMKALSTVAVLLFVGSFGLGLGPVPFLLSTELVGPEAVGAVQSWALAANWIATFMVAQFFPLLNQALGSGNTFFVFAGLDIIFFTFIFFYVPETMGKKNADEVWNRKPRQED